MCVLSSSVVFNSLWPYGLCWIKLGPCCCPSDRLYPSMDCSPQDSTVHGVLQARKLYELPLPSPGDLPYPGIEPGSPTLQVDSLLSEPPGKPQRLNKGVGKKNPSAKSRNHRQKSKKANQGIIVWLYHNKGLGKYWVEFGGVFPWAPRT